MEISFSKQQLKKLVEIAAIAEWVLTALDEEDDPRKDEYMKVLQKIYRSGYQNGMKEEIEHLEDVDEFFRPPTGKKAPKHELLSKSLKKNHSGQSS